METVNVIHEHNEQKADPFWWIFYFIALSVAFLFGLALIIGPLLLYVMFQSAWLLILLVFVPAGAWIVRKLYHYTRKLIWHNTHLSSYVLQEGNIKTEEWTDAFQSTPFRSSIDIPAIQSIIASSYIVRQTRALRSQGGTGQTITETDPILYVIYSQNNERKLLTVPFSYKNEGINTWLKQFQEKKVPLKYTATVLYRTDMNYLNNKKRLNFLESTDDLIDFSFSGNWQTQVAGLWQEWMKKEEKKQKEEEAMNPELCVKKKKHSFRTWRNVTLGVFFLMIATSYGTIELAKRHVFSADSIIPGLIIFSLAGFLYFYLLRSHLRWYYNLLFAAKAFFFGIMVLSAFEENGALADEMATSIAGISFLVLAFVWIPYLIVKGLTKRKDG